MKDEKLEQCKHEWETIEESREFIGRAGNAILGGADHFRRVYIQKCKFCGKIHIAK